MIPLPRASSRWAYPVPSPWKHRRTGNPIALLTSRQHTLDWTVRRAIRMNPWTLERLATVTGDASRGHVYTQLRRLRQLERIGFMTKHGRNGWTRVWIPRCVRQLTRAPRQRRQRGNDSGSTPSGTFLTAAGLVAGWRSDRSPPPAPRRGEPGRRRAVPRFLWGSCPAGHRVRLTRWSYTVTATTLEGRWGAACGRRGCGQAAIEHVRAIVAPAAARPLSPAELADPSLYAARRARALALLGDRSLPAELRARLAADYGPDRDPAAATIPDRGAARAG